MPKSRDYDDGKRHRAYIFVAWPTFYSKLSERVIRNFDWMDNHVYDHLKNDVKYLVAGREICPDTGKEHHQGYVIWKNGKTKQASCRLFPEATSLIIQRADDDFDAAKYCWKDGDLVVEMNKRPTPGSRNDISGVRALVKAGNGMRAVTDSTESFQAIRTAEVMLRYHEPVRTWKPEVFWYWGAPGTGKTRLARKQAGKDAWISGRSLLWWHNYDAHENVIIDDFRDSFCSFQELLRILDREPYLLEIKGSFRQLLAKRIWITSCRPPKSVYTTGEDTDQLLRRIDRVVHFEPSVKHLPMAKPATYRCVDGEMILDEDSPEDRIGDWGLDASCLLADAPQDDAAEVKHGGDVVLPSDDDDVAEQNAERVAEMRDKLRTLRQHVDVAPSNLKFGFPTQGSGVISRAEPGPDPPAMGNGGLTADDLECLEAMLSDLL